MDCTAETITFTYSTHHTELRVGWSKATPLNVENDRTSLMQNLPAFPSFVLDCLSLNCEHHQNLLDWYAHTLVSVHLASANKFHFGRDHLIVNSQFGQKRLLTSRGLQVLGIRYGVMLGALLLVKEC